MSLVTDSWVKDTWAEQEAFDEAMHLKELLEEGQDEHYLAKEVVKTRLHWERVFDDVVDLHNFINTFNKLVSEFDDSVTLNKDMFFMEV